MTLSNQNLNIENTQIERRNTISNNNENLNLNSNNENNNNNIVNNINYNTSINHAYSHNARENSVNEMSNLYFNIFSEVNNLNNYEVGNENELMSGTGRNFDNELDEVFQNLTYLINSERYFFSLFLFFLFNFI